MSDIQHERCLASYFRFVFFMVLVDFSIFAKDQFSSMRSVRAWSFT